MQWCQNGYYFILQGSCRGLLWVREHVFSYQGASPCSTEGSTQTYASKFADAGPHGLDLGRWLGCCCWGACSLPAPGLPIPFPYLSLPHSALLHPHSCLVPPPTLCSAFSQPCFLLPFLLAFQQCPTLGTVGMYFITGVRQLVLSVLRAHRIGL